MIIEAFSAFLQQADPAMPATRVLAMWLWERLTLPAQNNVDRVIRYEIVLNSELSCITEQEELEPQLVFTGASPTGERLLNSLFEYAKSYDQHRFSRFLHCVKASDFKPEKEKDDLAP